MNTDERRLIHKNSCLERGRRPGLTFVLGINKWMEVSAVMDFTPGTSTLTSTELQDLWFVESNTTGWMYASDWHDPAVEALCDACLRGENLWPAGERLGSARATAGASLGETLADVDALAVVLPTVATDILHRAVSLGWANQMTEPAESVFDPLTGLVSPEYLRTRLGEVYRAADITACKVSASHALVVVQLNLADRAGWERITPLILVGDALRTVFDGGQSLARMTDHMAVALTEREAMLARRTQLLAGMVGEGWSRDASDACPRVWIESLPDSLPAALNLIGALGR